MAGMFATDCTLPVPSAACQSLAAPPYLVWGIDWSRPWLESVRRIGEPLALCIAQGLPVHVALNRALPVALQGWQFVPQSALPEGVAYEAFIHKQQCIPTRDNWHDFFNGLVWLHWPQLSST